VTGSHSIVDQKAADGALVMKAAFSAVPGNQLAS